VYKMVHTGPNIQLGGVKKGLFKVVYHVFIESIVKKPEPPPINKHKNTHKRGRKMC